MVWRYVEKKVKNSFYPDLYYWSHNIPRSVKISIFKKYGLNIRFESIPENLTPMLYVWHFGKFKGWHYPTDDDIKFFYFTLFKKNGFLFMISCYLLYMDCFLEFLVLVIKSGIAFYLIIYSIYMLLLLRKYLRITVRTLYRTPTNCILTLILISINQFLNIIYFTKKKWYF